MAEGQGEPRSLQVGRSIFEPAQPRARTVQPRKPSDFPHVAQAHLEIAQKLSSPLVGGPPLCEELVALVQHVFTEEEASVVRHLGTYRGHSAKSLARAEHRPLEEIGPILARLAHAKRVIIASGREEKETFRLMPILPGIFESTLISENLEDMSPWHRRLAELIEAMYSIGYYGDYVVGGKLPGPFVRVLSVGRSIEAHPMALPSDHLEVVLDRFKVFAVGQCQCRMTQKVIGAGCDGPIQVCTLMGHWAKKGIQAGRLRQVSQSEVLQIKRNAEEHGLVTWIMNVESTKGQASCSCCPCCCYAFRMVNDFNVPGVLAPAHFLPRFDTAACTYCGKCAQKCPTHAISIDPIQKTRSYRRERCLGCGLCAVACDRHKAVTMDPVPDYQLPYRSWFSMIASSAPTMAKRAWNVWRSR